MKGFYQQIAVIDLTERSYTVQQIDERVYRDYLGGKGLSSYLLCRMNPENVSPLSPDNHIIFSTGAVTGSLTWGSSRYGVFTKSPLTGIYSESYSGGKVPEKVGATGFDAVVLKGRAPFLTLLEVGEDTVKFHDATHLKGKDTFETEALLKKDFPGAGAVVTGVAAENQVFFSTIKNDGWRCAGRTGTGTVMGSKNLKAAVFHGERKREHHSPEKLKTLAKELAAESKENPGVKAYRTMGTSQMVRVVNSARALPTKYWKMGQCPHWEKINSDALHERCRVKPHACAKCFLSCGRMSEVKQGRHKGLKLEGPEYETIYAFGGLCMIDSIEEIAYLNSLCDAFGMDTITAGNLCAFAMEAYRLGKSDFKIEFGDADKTAYLLKMMATREGPGDTLSQGIVRASRAWNMTDEAVHVKGMEPAGYDPRVLKGMGLGYATSDRGACHLRATFYKPELSGMIEPDQIEGKAELFVDFEDRLAIFDTMILCRFFRDLYPWDILGELVSYATGIDGSKENLKRIASNIASKVREFNVQEGLSKDDDTLPPALFHPLEDTGAAVTRQEMERLINDYYAIRGF